MIAVPVRTVSDQAVDDILGTLGLTPEEKLTLAHRLLADVAQVRAGTDSGRRLQLLVLQLRVEIQRIVRASWGRA